jgi:uncharacterized protein (UPF0332 family)
MTQSFASEIAANVGDYGGTAHVSRQEVEQAIEAASQFLEAIKPLL